MEKLTNSKALSPEQQKRLALAQKGLNSSVMQCKDILLAKEDSIFLRNARQGINVLSLAEASWLNQKDWDPVEKTYILYHVNNERSKEKTQKLSLYDIGITAGLALTAAATYLDGYRHFSAMLAILTVAKTMDIAIDRFKNQTISKMTSNHLNNLSQNNEHVQLAIRCLTPQAIHTR